MGRKEAISLWVTDLQLSGVNILAFRNPPPLFPATDCPVVWEWAVDVSSAAASSFQPSRDHEFDINSRHSGVPQVAMVSSLARRVGEDAEDQLLEEAEESDEGSEEMFGN